MFDVPEETKIEVNIALADKALEAGVLKLGEPSNYACPECHGVLLQLKEDAPLRFRCHTGHAYSADSLLSEITENVEASLWNAIRAIDESAMLLRHMAEHVGEAESADGVAEQFLEKAEEAERRSGMVRRAVFSHENLSEQKVADPVGGADASAAKP
jgi:two-component system chemotaxis response regulator CheB